jgi:hypothetical protein
MDVARANQAGGSFMLDWNALNPSNTGKGYRRDFFNRPTSQLAQFEMHTTALNADSISTRPIHMFKKKSYWCFEQCGNVH